ncbi:hypothetical protein [Synechococcus sp. UW140]|uniref:hypothetical protein n=1 Tax=Synechococcus sp. UW140 TaxID=368503 RepID=UPI000E0F1938|nr:hypothetical protein [Synechococcus sp. UW140]
MLSLPALARATESLLRLSFAGSVALLLTATAGCGLVQSPKKQGQPPTTRLLRLALCAPKSGVFLDHNADVMVSVGDRLSYVVPVAEVEAEDTHNCAQPIGTLYGGEEIVERRTSKDGAHSYLTDMQGTVMLPEGNLRLMAMGALQFTPQERSSIVRGEQAFSLRALFPEPHAASVQGQGGDFAGLIGTAKLEPGRPPLLLISLFPQVTLNR